MKLGTDIIEIERIAKAIIRPRFSNRVYTSYELNYAHNRGKQQAASLAGIYAAKEAFVKALGTGFRHGSWQDIEIRHDELGAPYVVLYGVFKQLYTTKAYHEITLSISHCQTYAVATILLG